MVFKANFVSLCSILRVPIAPELSVSDLISLSSPLIRSLPLVQPGILTITIEYTRYQD